MFQMCFKMPLTRGNFCPLNWSVGARFCKLICLAVFWFISLSHPSISIYPFLPISEMSFPLKCVVCLLKIKGKKKVAAVLSTRKTCRSWTFVPRRRIEWNWIFTLRVASSFLLSALWSLDISEYHYCASFLSSTRLLWSKQPDRRRRCANLHKEGKKITTQLATANIYIQQPFNEWAMFERTAVDGGYRGGVAAPFNF